MKRCKHPLVHQVTPDLQVTLQSRHFNVLTSRSGESSRNTVTRELVATDDTGGRHRETLLLMENLERGDTGYEQKEKQKTIIIDNNKKN